MSQYRYSVTVKEIVDTVPSAIFVRVGDDWFDDIPKDKDIFDVFYARIADEYHIGSDWFPPNQVYVGNIVMDKLSGILREKLRKERKLAGDKLEYALSFSDLGSGPQRLINWDTEIVGADAVVLPEADEVVGRMLFSLHREKVQERNLKIARMAHGKSFYEWLCCSAKRDDWIGDLAREVRCDPNFPKAVITYLDTIGYFDDSWGSHDVENLTRVAWGEYLKKYPERLQPMVMCTACKERIFNISNAILTYGGFFSNWDFFHDTCFDDDDDEFEEWTSNDTFVKVENLTIDDVMSLLNERLNKEGRNYKTGYKDYSDWIEGMESVLFSYGIPNSINSRKRSKARVGNPTVYFIEMLGHDKVKIGYTTSLQSRLKALGTSAPAQLKVLFSFEADRHTERELHKRFEHLRENREWFRLDDEILSYIESLRN